MKLNPMERLQLINQYLILEKMDPENQKHYQKCSTIVEYGYEYNYSDLHTLPEPLPSESSILVYDILHMFDVIALAKRYDSSISNHRNFNFRGFDANSCREGRLFEYTVFLKNQGLFKSVLIGSANSHMEMLTIYRKMLDIFNEIEPTLPHDKTAASDFIAKIKKILEAA